MKKVSVRKFKAQCLSLIEEVRKSQQPILITQGGRPLVKLVPMETAHKRFLGRLEGIVKVVGDIERPILPAKRWNALR